jgi:hypothetical protein
MIIHHHLDAVHATPAPNELWFCLVVEARIRRFYSWTSQPTEPVAPTPFEQISMLQ